MGSWRKRYSKYRVASLSVRSDVSATNRRSSRTASPRAVPTNKTEMTIDIRDIAIMNVVFAMYHPRPGLIGPGPASADSSTSPQMVTDAKCRSSVRQVLDECLVLNSFNFHEKSSHPQMALPKMTSGK
jgi:hypothetical protein